MASELDHDQRLKAAIHYTVGKMCEEQGDKTKVTYSRDVVASITELVWRNIKIWTKDVEAFARHGKRSTVNIEDVKLLVRRNDSLREKIELAFKPLQQTSLLGKSTKGAKGPKKSTEAPSAVGPNDDFALVDLDDEESNFSTL